MKKKFLILIVFIAGSCTPSLRIEENMILGSWVTKTQDAMIIFDKEGFSFEEVVIGTYTLDSINQEKKSLYVTMSAQGQRAFLTVAFQTKDTAVFDLMGKKEIFCRQLSVQ